MNPDKTDRVYLRFSKLKHNKTTILLLPPNRQSNKTITMKMQQTITTHSSRHSSSGGSGAEHLSLRVCSFRTIMLMEAKTEPILLLQIFNLTWILDR